MLLIDWTHIARRASGIERISTELFSPEALAPLPVRNITGSKFRGTMIAQQQLMLPALALANPHAVAVFPGYPPPWAFSALRARTVMYAHDLFLITRRSDLNRAGHYYLAPQFKHAIRRLKYFLTNSETTARELAAHVADDAEILTYRPSVSNVFGLTSRPPHFAVDAPLVIGTVGTIEPRKNLLAAAQICEALAARLNRPVEFHVIGRDGWGGDAAALAAMPHVRRLGYLSDEDARHAIGRFDVFLSASHDEGLGLPLLETQYAGIPVVAPDKPVFREVLGASGMFIDASNASEAAGILAAALATQDWQRLAADKAAQNIARWNALAASDRAATIAFLQLRLDAVARR